MVPYPVLSGLGGDQSSGLRSLRRPMGETSRNRIVASSFRRFRSRCRLEAVPCISRRLAGRPPAGLRCRVGPVGAGHALRPVFSPMGTHEA